jgi:tetratricopeptide (TPR) repeat protein
MKVVVAIVVIVATSGGAHAGPTAEELYDQGKAAYDHGDYTIAILDWERSYSLSHEPALLFNLAQANRLLGDCAQALFRYKRFVDLDPKSEQRGLADDFIRELEPTCGTPTQSRTDRVEKGSGQELKVAGLVTGGAGALSLVIGLGLGHHASTLGDEVTAACTSSCDWQAVKDKDAAGRRDAGIGYALDAVGIAAIAGGAIMYYLGDREHAVTISPRPRDGGAVVSWSGSW